MSVNDSITRIRRYVRDPSSRVFTDAHLLSLYNHVRSAFFAKSKLRARAVTMINPPAIRFGCTYRWEQGLVDRCGNWTPFYEDKMNNRSCTQPWEVQLSHGLDNTETGGIFVTNPADIEFVLSINPVYHILPKDFLSPIFVAWRGTKIEEKTIGFLESYDYSWKARRSNEVLFFALDYKAQEKVFISYPCPTVSSVDISGNEGFPIYVSGSGFTWAESGDDPIAFGASSLDPVEEDAGIISEIGSIEGSFTLFFYSVPEDITDSSEEDIYIPRVFRKFLEFGVAARAMKAHTELMNDEKSKFFSSLYEFGVTLVKNLRNKQEAMIDTRLKSLEETSMGTRLGRPRLPSNYGPVRYK